MCSIKQECEQSLNNVLSRTIAHTSYYSIDYMCDRELREAIVEELLNVTMMERKNNFQLDFGYNQLFKFVMRHHHKRIKKALVHEEICELITRQEINGKIQLRIKNNTAILQACMEYCGVYYDGFTIPEGVTVYGLTPEVKELIAHNGVDEVASFISKEVFTIPSSTEKHYLN